jgi:hypothetical protein
MTTAEALAKHKIYYDDCVFINKYTLAERLQKYPYSKAVKILAVSYISMWDNFGPDEKKPQKFLDKKTELYIKNGVLDTSTLIEIKELTPDQIGNLTNIVYNTDLKVHDQVGFDTGGACFYPRNALIFYNAEGKVFDYMEICFQCHEFHSLSKRFEIGTDCNQKYDLLKSFFKDIGIRYGIIELPKMYQEKR